MANIAVLVVAGGGAGGCGANGGGAGGGGGGGVIYNSSFAVSPGSYEVIVGDGGSQSTSHVGGSGQDSVFSTITATGLS